MMDTVFQLGVSTRMVVSVTISEANGVTIQSTDRIGSDNIITWYLYVYGDNPVEKYTVSAGPGIYLYVDSVRYTGGTITVTADMVSQGQRTIAVSRSISQNSTFVIDGGNNGGSSYGLDRLPPHHPSRPDRRHESHEEPKATQTGHNKD